MARSANIPRSRQSNNACDANFRDLSCLDRFFVLRVRETAYTPMLAFASEGQLAGRAALQAQKLDYGSIRPGHLEPTASAGPLVGRRTPQQRITAYLCRGSAALHVCFRASKLAKRTTVLGREQTARLPTGLTALAASRPIAKAPVTPAAFRCPPLYRR